MRQWFVQLAPARQRLLGVVVASAVVVVGAWTSMSVHDHVEALRRADIDARQTLAQVEDLMPRQGTGGGMSGTAIAPAELVTRLDASLRQAGLAASSLQLDAGVVHLRFDGADFNAVTVWLESTSQWPGVTMDTFSAGGNGQGGARIALSLRATGVDASR